VADGERLDRYLVRTGLAASRRQARELLANGLVRVNGRILTKGHAVEPSDRVQVEQAYEGPALKSNPEIPLAVLFEDPAMLVVDKPGLLPCHPIRRDERETLMNAVVARFPETADAGDKPLEGGLVHRLDNGTSGALIIARNPASFAFLRSAIRGGRIERHYLALLSGHPGATLELTAPIAHHPKNRRKMIVVHEHVGAQGRVAARPALTIVEPIRRIGASTLVRVIPKSGTRHQIRAHLADAGFPLMGDELYGGPPLAHLPPGRFFLHLSRMRVVSPAGGGQCTIEAPLPSDLTEALAAIGG
jgi:23S rRNA pseudouridine1911/1915/1917 synthase